MLILPSKDNLQEGVLMNKKSFWLYVVIMTMAVIAVVLAIFILVVTDNKKPSNQHFKEEVSSQVTKATESDPIIISMKAMQI